MENKGESGSVGVSEEGEWVRQFVSLYRTRRSSPSHKATEPKKRYAGLRRVCVTQGRESENEFEG